MLHTGTKFTSPQGRLEMTMTTKANAQIQALTSALVHITNMHKVYGAKSAISDTSYIADILLQSLETIRALQKERDDLIDEINEVEEMRRCIHTMIRKNKNSISR